MKKHILFIGDSITDAGRKRVEMGEPCYGMRPMLMGAGYCNYIAGRLSYDYPGEYEFTNRGISGHRVVDVYARIKKDCINHSPDYISILLGVNDVWHEASEGNGVETDRFEQVYDMMISYIKEKLPNTKIILIEPFWLPGEATTGVNERGVDRESAFREGVLDKANAVKRVALKHNLPLVLLQDQLFALQEANPDEVYLADGVHPAYAGYELMTREWIKVFETIR